MVVLLTSCLDKWQLPVQAPRLTEQRRGCLGARIAIGCKDRRCERSCLQTTGAHRRCVLVHAAAFEVLSFLPAAPCRSTAQSQPG